MTPTRLVGPVSLALVGLLVLQLPFSAAAAEESDAGFGSNFGGNSVFVSGTSTPHRQVSETGASRAGEATYVTARRSAAYCGTLDTTSTGVPCVDGAASGAVVRFCADGSRALDPLYRRALDPATGEPVGVWEPTADLGGCPEDPAPAPVVLTAAEFRRLPLTPSAPQVQPADGRNLVDVDVIALTDPAPQTLTTTVLGVAVTVRAIPTTWTWDFGDGTTPLTTTDPGAPWPHPTITHPYTAPGTYTLTLTTTWTGQYQVAGTSTWQPVTGTATTTSPPITLTAEEAPTRLVADPLP